jgi:hypothetical protein
MTDLRQMTLGKCILILLLSLSCPLSFAGDKVYVVDGKALREGSKLAVSRAGGGGDSHWIDPNSYCFLIDFGTNSNGNALDSSGSGYVFTNSLLVYHLWTNSLGDVCDYWDNPDGGVRTLIGPHIAALHNTNQWTLILWDKNHGSSQEGYLSENTSAADNRISLLRYVPVGIGLYADYANSGVYGATEAKLTPETWHFIALVYDGTQAAGSRVRMSLDGTNVTGLSDGWPSSLLDNSAGMLVGIVNGYAFSYSSFDFVGGIPYATTLSQQTNIMAHTGPNDDRKR